MHGCGDRPVTIAIRIEACTNKRVEAVVGKPSRHMSDAILNLIQIPGSQCLIVGDRLETDVQMGINAGMASALTLTGATTREQLKASEIAPTYVIESLLELVS